MLLSQEKPVTDIRRKLDNCSSVVCKVYWLRNRWSSSTKLEFAVEKYLLPDLRSSERITPCDHQACLLVEVRAIYERDPPFNKSASEATHKNMYYI